MKIIKNENILEVTQKAFEAVYIRNGYKPYEEDEVVEEEQTEHTFDELVYDDVTKADISKILAEKGIKHDNSLRKQELFDLLRSGE